jgi:DnaK suppressor protein
VKNLIGGEMSESARNFDATFLANQRARLLEMQAAILGSSSETTQASTREKTEASPKTTPNFRDHRLGDVQRALQKIDEGTYGLSDESGDPIPLPRLEAFPDALYTEREQEEQEEGK